MQIFGLGTLNLHILESFFNSMSLRIRFYASMSLTVVDMGIVLYPAGVFGS